MLNSHEHEEEHGGSVVECLTRDPGLQVRASLEAMCCVLEQGIVLVQPRKTHSDMTEKVFTGT